MYQSMFHLDYLWLNDFNVGLGTGELGYIRIRMWVGLIIFSGKVLYISTDIDLCDWLRLANTLIRLLRILSHILKFNWHAIRFLGVLLHRLPFPFAFTRVHELVVVVLAEVEISAPAAHGKHTCGDLIHELLIEAVFFALGWLKDQSRKQFFLFLLIDELELDVCLSLSGLVEDLNNFFRGIIRSADSNLRWDAVGIFERKFDQFDDRQSDVFFARVGNGNFACSRHIPSLFLGKETMWLLESSNGMFHVQPHTIVNKAEMGKY